MKLTVTRLYKSIAIEGTECRVGLAKQVSLDFYADGVTNIEEVDEIIHQLHQLKNEITGGYCRPTLLPNGTFGWDVTEPPNCQD